MHTNFDWLQVSNFIRFARSPNNPVYLMHDAADQRELQLLAVDVLTNPEVVTWGLADQCRLVVRFASIAAISGRPSTLQRLSTSLATGTDMEILRAIQDMVFDDVTFFRGGQAHGSLEKSALPAACEQFFAEHVPKLAVLLESWASASTQKERGSAARLYMQGLMAAAPCFRAGNYFVKRAVEITLLVGMDHRTKFEMAPLDVDACLDIWPLGPGTRDGAQRICPRARGEVQLRQVLRVLQRSLGGGKRRFPIVAISAMICFWKQCEEGERDWPYQRLAA